MKELVVMEIGRLSVSVTEYGEQYKTIGFKWVESMPPPYTDNDVEVEIDEDAAAELINTLKLHFSIK